MKKNFFLGLAELERLAQSPCAGCLFFSPMGCQIKTVVADYHHLSDVPKDFAHCQLYTSHRKLAKFITSDYFSNCDKYSTMIMHIISNLNFYLEDKQNDKI